MYRVHPSPDYVWGSPDDNGVVCRAGTCWAYGDDITATLGYRALVRDQKKVVKDIDRLAMQVWDDVWRATDPYNGLRIVG